MEPVLRIGSTKIRSRTVKDEGINDELRSSQETNDKVEIGVRMGHS